MIARTNMVARKAAECHRKRYRVETRGCRVWGSEAISDKNFITIDVHYKTYCAVCDNILIDWQVIQWK